MTNSLLLLSFTALLLPAFSADQDVINAVGAPMAGLFNTAHWAPDFTNPANQKFMAEFEKEYKRVPTLYASQGYDAAQLINAAIRDAKGKVSPDNFTHGTSAQRMEALNRGLSGGDPAQCNYAR